MGRLRDYRRALFGEQGPSMDPAQRLFRKGPRGQGQWLRRFADERPQGQLDSAKDKEGVVMYDPDLYLPRTLQVVSAPFSVGGTCR